MLPNKTARYCRRGCALLVFLMLWPCFALNCKAQTMVYHSVPTESNKIALTRRTAKRRSRRSPSTWR